MVNDSSRRIVANHVDVVQCSNGTLNRANDPKMGEWKPVVSPMNFSLTTKLLTINVPRVR